VPHEELLRKLWFDAEGLESGFSIGVLCSKNGQVESFRSAPIGSHWGAGWVLFVWSSSILEPHSSAVQKLSNISRWWGSQAVLAGK